MQHSLFVIFIKVERPNILLKILKDTHHLYIGYGVERDIRKVVHLCKVTVEKYETRVNYGLLNDVQI